MLLYNNNTFTNVMYETLFICWATDLKKMTA